MTTPKLIYSFTKDLCEGQASDKNLLGGKGANLAEMVKMDLPVPPGFTISTDACTYYYSHNRSFGDGFKEQVLGSLKLVEKQMGMKFGDASNPLLLSVRSGARMSMPGMMETVLNIGLNDATAQGMIAKTNNPRFVYDSQRRLIQMYSDVVMEKADIDREEPEEGMGIRDQLEKELQKMKRARGVKNDHELSADDLKALIPIYKAKVLAVLGQPFPEDPFDQLWGGIMAVVQSWMGKRAISYRKIEGIPGEWGTAVNIQTMVFGNVGASSGTGVAFTRNPATGENAFYGEWLGNAQGEDVVAGIRTPNPLNEHCRTPQSATLQSLEQANPQLYSELVDIRNALERHYRDMLDIEFTIQEGVLYMLQCRVGKRNGPAAVQMAVDMVKEGLITSRMAVSRVLPRQLDELLHPIIDPAAEKKAKVICKGLPAGPGGAQGRVVFSAAAAIEWASRKETVILVREETNPEDVAGMRAANAILTARGGMTSHAALVARGWGKCCIVGADDLEVDARRKSLRCGGVSVQEGDYITLNGTKGLVYLGQLPLLDMTMGSEVLMKFLMICQEHSRMHVRANADSPVDAQKARDFGASGIGLFRTEHMFYGAGCEEPLFHLRRMIMAETTAARRQALDDLFPYIKASIKATLAAMDGLPVTIRLLDPPLHEFVPQSDAGKIELAQRLGVTVANIEEIGERLHENNPMMGHRGCRLGVTYPEITECQVNAILEASVELKAEGIDARPEIMVPLTSMKEEFTHQKTIIDRQKACYPSLSCPVGTMIETPRGALQAKHIAEAGAEFFSFGTNDLTQLVYGFSRDDVQSFLPEYEAAGLIRDNPFAVLDQEGVGELVRLATARGREAVSHLHVGVCGEHGGDPSSVEFFHQAGLDYVSCSPFRVPIARLAAARASVA
eukprot:CAMPEP_0114552068 /NCGR_PEP_ID=MMETSP0114-20121206/6930_1 /TAXON_ID=31324 /ORGANISM="Goniomonas sp, Strain m" /LENGTH=901 /DNA_ID=CAMNT_0001736925 /DNA_START=12 /DNA_END=2717 /DNA_ORIENTATION=-